MDNKQYLTFLISGELFAFNINQVKEILEVTNYTPVPLVEVHIRGVTNLRGSVVPIIDLNYVFHNVPSSIGKRSCNIIMWVPNDVGCVETLGVLVDSVVEVLEIEIDQVEKSPSFGCAINTYFIEGILRVNERLAIILDMKKILDSLIAV
jgi:purine-binding chemotaxis protein CheW